MDIQTDRFCVLLSAPLLTGLSRRLGLRTGAFGHGETSLTSETADMDPASSDDEPGASSSIEYVSNSSLSYDLALAAERGDRAYEFDQLRPMPDACRLLSIL